VSELIEQGLNRAAPMGVAKMLKELQESPQPIKDECLDKKIFSASVLVSGKELP
jgi:hypothetical protein